MNTIQSIVPKTYLSAHNYCRYAISLKINIETHFLALGEMLKKIRDESMWKGTFSSFEEFCFEMDYTESRASKLITVYDYFVNILKIDESRLIKAGGWSNLYELYQAADGRQNPETFVNETLIALSEPLMGGRQRYLKQLKTGIDPMTCEHQFRDLSYRKCDKCGETERIYTD